MGPFMYLDMLLCMQTAWMCLGYTLTSRGAMILSHMPIPRYQSDVIHLEVRLGRHTAVHGILRV